MNDTKTIYLDVCCLNRPFDDQTQDRIRLEAEAVILILGHVETGKWSLVGSEVMIFEIDRTPDPERRNRMTVLVESIDCSFTVDGETAERASAIEAFGVAGFDALHLACAERVGADLFLTTDDRLLRAAGRVAKKLRVKVADPVTWLREGIDI